MARYMEVLTGRVWEVKQSAVKQGEPMLQLVAPTNHGGISYLWVSLDDLAMPDTWQVMPLE